jgi:type VI secretion system ImpC/EvpB family protein
MARSSFDFNLGTTPERDARRLDDEAPMRILVFGDFSARGAGPAREGDDYAKRRPIAVDVDTIDQALRRFAPQYATASGDKIAFGEIDDFHPDALYRKVPVFERLRDLRQRMQNASTFDAAAEAFRGEVQVAEPAADARRPDEKDEDTLSRLLGGSAPAGARTVDPKAGIDAFIRGIVAEHITPDAPAHQAQYIAAADAAIGAHMNAILHAPAYQALEALWRGVYWLVSNLELGESLKLYLLDATKPELLHDALAAENDLTRSATYKTLVEAPQVAGAEPWSLVVGAYEFGPGGEDVALLATLGAVASQAGAAFIASASPALAGTRSYSTADVSEWSKPEGAGFEAWNALRRSAMAPYIGLTAPRMLLRLPYGKATDPVSAFEFDELGTERAHDAYLWGGGALACALLIGRAFTERGWEMEPGDALDVDDLPAHSYVEDGEKKMQACAESFVSERAGQALIERGLIPLLSYANRNAIRVMRFQSIAEPPQALSGPWS